MLPSKRIFVFRVCCAGFQTEPADGRWCVTGAQFVRFDRTFLGCFFPPLCLNCSESRESATWFAGGGKVRGWRHGAAPRAAVIPPEVLSDMMDEKGVPFWRKISHEALDLAEVGLRQASEKQICWQRCSSGFFQSATTRTTMRASLSSYPLRASKVAV